jgi:hypothetical protein
LIHEPVAGNERHEPPRRRVRQHHDQRNRRPRPLRLGVTFDDQLNHHPRKPRTPFDPAHPRAFLRVERQTIWGFPALGAALFTIRTYLYDCEQLRRDPATRDPLVAALQSMPLDSKAYKGLSHHADELLTWLIS